MWNTILGLRTLEGAEAEFYLEAMQLAVDYLEQYAEAGEEVDIFTYDRIFDSAARTALCRVHSSLLWRLLSQIGSQALGN